ncbi:ABC transporter permease [Nocardiopsis gilva YIM 90087]|uniref:ABC transporter permease n=1 Tax=Nocardiopsis gilva YIM 90087 TaxID=1235441 RepID=A0A223S7P8_9ACTN|nr:ABC transporter permease subunit [Nocardiopsis gilva]ASU84151.1 ABC transporter permease [Nocardiopsis gilva YIM 90087]
MSTLNDPPHAGAPEPPGPARTRSRAATWLRTARDYAGAVPFFAFVAVFLLWPTGIVVSGALTGADGTFSLENVAAVTGSVHLAAFGRSVWLSLITALIGAIAGALLSWAISSGAGSAGAESRLRRVVTAFSGVLAQFGGVMLAFAFLATVGLQGWLTLILRDVLGLDLFAAGNWLYDMPGLVLVYCYFQIPLMTIVFLPALDGLRKQWREANESLGGSAWHYWRYVAGPILAPAFAGSFLLLFANAFSSFATAAALVSQGGPIVTLQIRNALTSEVILGQADIGYALAFGMVVVVAVVMSLYALLQRRTARWLR